MVAKPKPSVSPDWHERRASGKPESPIAFKIPTNHHFQNVPTHAVNVVGNRRNCARAFLRLPLRLTAVDGADLEFPIPLETRNISASGVYFLSPNRIEPGTEIAIEVALTDRPMGMGSVRMTTMARVVRTESQMTRGWFGLAASFVHYEFNRDESLPDRFRY
ncbi:MAG TPA: PilZ domain-containing protein [Candidatus Acidoferrales bacterium]|nr:PilZ domain-containing protein [Candidatus Acidoferrales bacterium]